MGERKVLNKYIPADFDPSLVPRGKKLSSKDGTVPVRMMLPFSVQCTTCNTFLYRGRKFNSKKEPMGGPSGKYLGIQRWRFYIKCTHCSRPITFLTDPQNADYEMESGGTRNYEVYKDQRKTEEAAALSKEEEEKMDHMKALENRVLDSQREMQDLDNLEEIKAMNRRHIKLLGATSSSSADGSFDASAKALLDAIEAKKSKGDGAGLDTAIEVLNEQDEELVKSIQFGKQQQQSTSSRSIQRLGDKDEQKLEQARQDEIKRLEQRQKEAAEKAKQAAVKKNKTGIFPIIVKTKKRRPPPPQEEEEAAPKKQPKVEPKPAAGGGLSSLLGGYGSSSDSD